MRVREDGGSEERGKSALMPGCFATAPQAVVMPHPRRQTRSRGALGLTATTETSATTVYCEKVEVPIYVARQWLAGFP